LGIGLNNFKAFTKINFNKDRSGYVTYLENNNLSFGYATFWNASITTELTNGKVNIQSVNPPEQNDGWTLFLWLTPKKYLDGSYIKSAEYFLLLSQSELRDALSATNNFFQSATPAYSDNSYVIFKFTSLAALNSAIF
jgi:hypothetical protein